MKEQYIMWGKDTASKKTIISGLLTVHNEDNVFLKVGDKGSYKTYRGAFASYRKMPSIVLLEWPPKRDAANNMYWLEKKTGGTGYEGRFEGQAFSDVMLYPDESVDIRDIPLEEILFGDMDFDEKKAIDITVDLEKYTRYTR